MAQTKVEHARKMHKAAAKYYANEDITDDNDNDDDDDDEDDGDADAIDSKNITIVKIAEAIMVPAKKARAPKAAVIKPAPEAAVESDNSPIKIKAEPTEDSPVQESSDIEVDTPSPASKRVRKPSPTPLHLGMTTIFPQRSQHWAQSVDESRITSFSSDDGNPPMLYDVNYAPAFDTETSPFATSPQYSQQWTQSTNSSGNTSFSSDDGDASMLYDVNFAPVFDTNAYASTFATVPQYPQQWTQPANSSRNTSFSSDDGLAPMFFDTPQQPPQTQYTYQHAGPLYVDPGEWFGRGDYLPTPASAMQGFSQFPTYETLYFDACIGADDYARGRELCDTAVKAANRGTRAEFLTYDDYGIDPAMYNGGVEDHAMDMSAGEGTSTSMGTVTWMDMDMDDPDHYPANQSAGGSYRLPPWPAYLDSPDTKPAQADLDAMMNYEA